MIEIEIDDDETIYTIDNKNQKEKEKLLPCFYCKICEKGFSYKTALLHLEENVDIHKKDCMISEEIINIQENEIITNILNKLEEKNNDINNEQKKVCDKMEKINKLEIYIYKNLEMLKEEYNNLFNILEEEKNKNGLLKEKIISYIQDNKNIKGVINKYNKLTSFQKVQQQLNNNYFNKNFSKEKMEEIQIIRDSFINEINSEFNFKEKNNNDKSLSLKEEFNSLNLDELKALNNILKENENSSSDIIIEIDSSKFDNTIGKKFLKSKRRSCYMNIDK